MIVVKYRNLKYSTQQLILFFFGGGVHTQYMEIKQRKFKNKFWNRMNITSSRKLIQVN